MPTAGKGAYPPAPATSGASGLARFRYSGPPPDSHVRLDPTTLSDSMPASDSSTSDVPRKTHRPAKRASDGEGEDEVDQPAASPGKRARTVLKRSDREPKARTGSREQVFVLPELDEDGNLIEEEITPADRPSRPATARTPESRARNRSPSAASPWPSLDRKATPRKLDADSPARLPPSSIELPLALAERIYNASPARFANAVDSSPPSSAKALSAVPSERPPRAPKADLSLSRARSSKPLSPTSARSKGRPSYDIPDSNSRRSSPLRPIGTALATPAKIKLSEADLRAAAAMLGDLDDGFFAEEEDDGLDLREPDTASNAAPLSPPAGVLEEEPEVEQVPRSNSAAAVGRDQDAAVDAQLEATDSGRVGPPPSAAAAALPPLRAASTGPADPPARAPTEARLEMADPSRPVSPMQPAPRSRSPLHEAPRKPLPPRPPTPPRRIAYRLVGNDLDGAIAHIRTVFDEAVDGAAGRASEAAYLRREISRLADELELRDKTIGELLAEAESLRSQNSQLQRQVDDSARERSAWQDDREALEQKIDVLKEIRRGLLAEIRELRADLVEAAAEGERGEGEEPACGSCGAVAKRTEADSAQLASAPSDLSTTRASTTGEPRIMPERTRTV